LNGKGENMKNKNNVILILTLCLAAFALGACEYWEASDQSCINITFDNSGARSTLDVLDDEYKKDLTYYTITLTSPGKETITRTTNKGDTSISIPVSEGKWNIKVKTEGNRVICEGTAIATVAGKPAFVPVKMNVTGTKVYSYSQIRSDFNNSGQSYMADTLTIELMNDFDVPSFGGGGNTNDNPSLVCTLNSGKTIILIAKPEKGVKIKRLIEGSNVIINNNVFRVKNGTLILDGNKGGSITIDGNYSGNESKIAYISNSSTRNSTRALINVDGSNGRGNLIMRGYVFLQNNYTGNGGGVYVAGSNYSFVMEGGEIRNNIAYETGGGVSVKSSGVFKKTGGTVFGNSGEKANSCTAGSGGDSVYLNGTIHNDDY